MNEKSKIFLVSFIYLLITTTLQFIFKNVYIGNYILNSEDRIFITEVAFIIMDYILFKIISPSNNFILKVYIIERYILLILVLLFYTSDIYMMIINLISTILIIKLCKNFVFKREKSIFESKEIEFKIFTMYLQEMIFLFST